MARIPHMKNTINSSHCYSHKDLRGTVVNHVCHYINSRSLEITWLVPVIKRYEVVET